MAKLHIKGDTVYTQWQGQRKKKVVLEVFPKDRKVIVEGINIVTKHVKPKPNQTLIRMGLLERSTHLC